LSTSSKVPPRTFILESLLSDIPLKVLIPEIELTKVATALESISVVSSLILAFYKIDKYSPLLDFL
jgi:hypothetical protein